MPSGNANSPSKRIIITNTTYTSESNNLNFTVSLNNSKITFNLIVLYPIENLILILDIDLLNRQSNEYKCFFSTNVSFYDMIFNNLSDSVSRRLYTRMANDNSNKVITSCPIAAVRNLIFVSMPFNQLI